MKILVLADIHGRENLIYMVQELTVYNFDAIFIAGDITDCGRGDAESILSGLPKPVFAVPGNCDPPHVLSTIEKNSVSLHRQIVNWKGYKLTGLGGVSNGYTLGIRFTDAEATNFLGRCERCIFLTHQPAYGILDCAGGRHIGSLGILSAVKNAKPLMVISGHVHEARGKFFDGTTLFVNPGPAMNGHAALVDLSTLEVVLLEPH